MAEVRLAKVDKAYGKGKEVLSDLSLEIRDREFLVLVGPSGCGKSTILRIIAGLEEVTRGEVWIGDQRVDGVPPKERDIAMVFQSYALYPHMSAYDNIAFGLRLRKTPKEELDRSVRDAARTLNIEPLLEKMPKHLSGGERQRVALGRAIVRQPRVFLFDEPLSNLDAKLRTEMRAEISALHQRLQVTTVYVTHDQVEAMTMGQRIVVLKDGFIQQLGAPLEIYRRPANRFVAAFIGSPRMNFFDAQVIGNGEPALQVGEIHRDIAPENRPALAQKHGRRVTLGVRPDDVRLAEAGPFAGRVTLVEPTGGESYIYADVGGSSLVARAEGDTRAQIGDELRFDFEPAKAHYFDAETEERID